MIKKIGLYFAIVCLFSFLSACTRAPSKGSSVIIKLPEKASTKLTKQSSSKSSSKVSSQKLGTPENWGLSEFTDINEIDCYAVAIEGPEEDMHQNTCVNTAGAPVFKTGPFIGAFAAGSQLSLEVPSGLGRTIRLVGFAAGGDTAQCHSIFNAGFSSTTLSPPAVISKVTMDLPPGFVEVTMVATMDGHEDFNDCNGPLFDSPTSSPNILVTLDSPAANSYVSSVNDTNLSLTGTCTGDGNIVDVSIAGNSISTPVCSLGNWSETLDVSALPDGPFTICLDHSNGIEAAPQTCVPYNKDTVGPAIPTTVTLASPSSPGAVSTPTINVTGANGDTIKVFDDASCISEVGSGVVVGSSASITVSSIATDGIVYYYATAEDPYGNAPSSCSTANALYELDTVAPTMPSIAGIKGVNSDSTADAFLTDGYQVKALWADVSGEDHYNLKIKDNPYTSVICTDSAASDTTLHTMATACDLDPGDYTFYIEAEDAAGNKSGYASYDFTVNAPTITILDAANAENTGSLSFNVNLSHITKSDVTVTATTSDSTATSPEDYTAKTEPVTITAGTTSQVFNVVINDDALNEDNETIDVNLSSPSSNATISDGSASGTITDDDTQPLINFTTATASVGESAGTITITAQLSAMSGKTVTANFSTTDGTAMASSDYTSISGSLTISPGSLMDTFDVSILPNAVYTGDKTFTAVISTPINAALGATVVNTVTINDDDSPALLDISDQSYDYSNVVANGGTDTHAFTVTNTGDATATAITPSLTSGSNFQLPGGGTCTATLPPGGDCEIIVEFIPNATGALSDTIILGYNDGAGTATPATNSIQGIGVTAALLSITPSSSFDFNNVVQYGSYEEIFTVTNNGDAPAMAIITSGFSGDYSSTDIDCDSATLMTGQDCSFKVILNPSSLGSIPSSFNVDYDNGSGGDSLTINLAANGVAGEGNWSSISGTGIPSNRKLATSVWTGTSTIVWGGHNGSVASNNGGIYRRYGATNVWDPVTLTNAPSPRMHHSAVWTGARMIVFGGKDEGNTNRMDGGIYEPVTNTWATLPSLGGEHRSNHSAVWTGKDMIVWGGDVNGTVKSNGFKYNLSSNSWSGAIQATGAPTARTEHAAAWTGKEMIIWGGRDGSTVTFSNTGMLYDPEANSWTAMSASNEPTGRRGFAHAWTGSKFIVWGGFDGSTELNDGGIYDPATDSWVTMGLPGAPSARIDAKAVWTGNYLIVWGGFDGTNHLNDGAIFDPSNNTWKPLSQLAAPDGRSLHTMTWMNDKLFIFGGEDGGIVASHKIIELNMPGNHIKKVELASDTACALFEDYRIKCWGNNAFGQRGVESTLAAGHTGSTMGGNLQVVQLGTGKHALDLVAGSNYFCALRNDYSVVCWGDSAYGKLGIAAGPSIGDGAGDMGDSLIAVNLSTTKARKIYAGDKHTCAIGDDNKSYCWGDNSSSQFSNTAASAGGQAPFPVKENNDSTDLANIVDMGLGADFSCFLTDKGEVFCSGANSFGQLGDGTTNQSNTVVNVDLTPIGPKSITSMKAGNSHNCLLASGVPFCWGLNSQGQLGDGTTTNRMSPVQVSLAGNKAYSLATGSDHSCFNVNVGSTMQLKCVGDNTYGKLGKNDSTQASTPTNVMSVGSMVEAVYTGSVFTCAHSLPNNLMCWGENTNGQLGRENTVHLGGGAGHMSTLTPIDLGL